MKLKAVLICLLVFLMSLQGLSSYASENELNGINNGYDTGVTIGYPTVDKMEQKTFGTVYADQDIYTRLGRLEQSVFGTASDASLIDRVDRLSEMLDSGRNYPATVASSPNIRFGQNYRQYSNFYNTSGTRYSLDLYDLERQFLGTAYPDEPVDIRLTRLENHLFSGASDNLPVEERVQRLIAYSDAKDSDEFYDNQAQINQYNALMKGANAISLLFMILQFFL